jgi:hypothetical protein
VSGELEGGGGGEGVRRGQLLKALVSVAIVGGLLWRVDLGALAGVVARIHAATAALVLLVYLSGQLVSATRWHGICRSAGLERPLAGLIRVYFGAMFFNLFAPATFGGDTMRVYALARGGGSRARALATVIMDRVVGLVVLLLIPAAAMAAFGAFGWPTMIAWLAPLIAAGLVVAPLLAAGPAAGVLPSRWRERLLGPGLDLWRSPRVWLRAALWSLLLHAHQLVAAMLLGSALGIDAPWRYYFVFHPLVIVFGALPMSFSGFGIREVGYVWALAELQGVDQASALAFGLCWSTLLVCASLVGGIVVLTGGGVPAGRRPA